jgi:hypothetical protein
MSRKHAARIADLAQRLAVIEATYTVQGWVDPSTLEEYQRLVAEFESLTGHRYRG